MYSPKSAFEIFSGEFEERFECLDSLKLKIIVGATNLFLVEDGANDLNMGFALLGLTDQFKL